MEFYYYHRSMSSDSRKTTGRPSLAALLATLDEELSLLPDRGILLDPTGSALERARELWIDEVHHSTALEGNTMTRAEVADLLDTGRTSGQTRLAEALDVQGYAEAVEWVSAHARGGRRIGLSSAEISELHRVALGPMWSVEPPPSREPAGAFRAGGVRVGQVAVSIPSAIRADLSDWSRSAARLREHPVVHAAEHHFWFERIHPFIDGNGRVGRLICNLMLLQSGYPRVVIESSQRAAYLRALRSADSGNSSPLSELLARAARRSLAGVLQVRLRGPQQLVPLSVLAKEAGLTSAYLRQLALKGRLRTTRTGRSYLSSRAWLEEYLAARDPRGHRKG